MPGQELLSRKLVHLTRNRDHLTQKREAEFERMLLPDAPPRKRQTKKISPECQPCIMVVPLAKLCDERRPAGPAEVAASTSAWSRAAERRLAGPAEAAASTSGMAHSVDIDAEVAVAAASSPSKTGLGLLETGTTYNKFDHVVRDWLQLTDLCDSDDDDDFNIDSDACLLPILQDHNMMTEPACDSDLTEFQAEVLQREDAANDRALRDIVPDDCYTFNWSRDRRTFLGQRETFTSPKGPTFDVTDQTREIDIFDKMFDTDFIDRLCTETNRNAEQKIAFLREQSRLTLHSRLNRWSPTNRDEMISFLAIHILQGLYPLPEEEAYFTYNGFGTMPYFAKIMSYNRFALLKTFLHFVDSETLQDTTKLCKIRPVIDYLNTKFSSLYMPSQEIAIDESLLKWHGRLSFTQKISSKAAKVGVKTYELCESSSGYLWRFFVYTGKDKPTTTTDSTDRLNTQPGELANDIPVGDEAIDRHDDDEPLNLSDRFRTGNSGDPPTNATAKIVYDLIEPLLHRGHTLVMDNFYNSPLLLRSLKKQKTDCYGTLRLNREFVPDSMKTLTKAELRQGEVVATYCSDLAFMVWRDANIVSMISTYHDLQIGSHDKHNKVIYKPNIVLDYNKNMGGVDRKDQFLSDHPMERVRNRVWYKKLFRRLYNAAVFNCFVIFSSFHRKISHRQFRIVLAEELLKRHRQVDLTTEYRRLNIRSNSTGQVTTTTLRRNVRHNTLTRPSLEHNHFPVRTGTKNTCCRLCPKKTRTIWKCEECDVNLCIEGCFKAYHKP